MIMKKQLNLLPIVLTLIYSLLDSNKQFDLKCTDFNINGVQRCIAGIDSEILDIRASDTQHASQWCWAASIQSVFSYYGYDLPQEKIVEETWGSIVNMPSQPQQILAALNREWTDTNGNKFYVEGNSFNANAITAAQDLANDQPLIIGTLGHAMVLTALEYDRDIYGRGQVINATVRDPWPFSSRRRSLTPQEWYNTSFLARIRIYDR